MVTLVMSLALATTPPPNAPRDPDANVAQDAQLEGIWPTSKMLDNVISRWADETSVKYDLESDQSAQLRKAMVDRWSGFAAENRSTLQPLLNEYLEAQFAMEAPEAESVGKWAKRALGIFDAFEQELIDTHRDMQEIMTAKQQIELAGESLKMTAGLEVFRAKLRTWERGEFEEREWWQRTPTARRDERVRGERDEAARKAKEKPKTPFDVEVDGWDAFVADFAEEYHFDDAQRAAADSILRECKQRADDHRRRNEAEFKDIDHQSAGAQKREVLYGPIDALFAELQSRVRSLPTTAQLATHADAARVGPEMPRDER